ncbi:MAG: hypothetical protein IT405_00895 [Candidatus Yanofskybacteria bacterium]|nr:hypothetical protein [Candidatus Yanofskybacteria bacterium]
MILLLFRRSTDHGVGERILADFGASFVAWAQVFDRVRGLYAVRVAQGDPVAWREALMRLPEVEWAEVVSSVSFSPRIS